MVEVTFVMDLALHLNHFAMTIEEFRTYPNCADYSDQEAKEILNSLELLSVILFEFTCRKNGIVIDNQCVKEGILNNSNLNLAA